MPSALPSAARTSPYALRVATSSPRSQVGSSPPEVSKLLRLAGLGLGDLDLEVAVAAELLDRGVGVVERLAVLAGQVLDRLDALALLGAGDDRRRLALGRLGLRVGGLDLVDVVAVDLDRVPAEGLDPALVAVEVPAEHRLAGLAEAVDVDDRDDVVQALPAGVLEGLPHRALGHLGVAAQAPDAVGQLVQVACRHRDADRDRQALAERARRHVRRRDPRGGVALQPRVELAEGQELLVVDRARRLEDRVVQRRGVALGEDQVVVGRVGRVVVVEPQVAVQQDGHQVGGRHRGRRVAGAGGGRAADRVDPQLLAEVAAEVASLAGHHAATSWSRLDSMSAKSSLKESANFFTPSFSSVSTTSS